MTVDEVAKKLEISVSLAYRLVESGKLRCCRHGLGRGVIRVSEDQLAEYLSSAEQGGRTADPETVVWQRRLKHIRL